MGMFDKDKEYGLRLDQSFPLNDPFIVWGASLPGKAIATDIGEAEVAELVCSIINDPNDKMVYNTVAQAIVEKVRDATPADFPAICELRRVKGRYRSDTLVLQYIKDYVM